MPQMAIVVALIGVELAGLTSTRTSAGPDGRYALHERDQSLAVVHVGARDADGQGQTGSLGDQVDLRAVPAPVHRIPTHQVPPCPSPQFHRVDRAPRPVQVASGFQFVEGKVVEFGPDLGLRRLGKPAVGCRAEWSECSRGQLLPGAAGRGQEHDRGQQNFPIGFLTRTPVSIGNLSGHTELSMHAPVHPAPPHTPCSGQLPPRTQTSCSPHGSIPAACPTPAGNSSAPPSKPGARPATASANPLHDLRDLMIAALYVDRTGIPGRYLPHDCPPHQTVYGYFARWEADGIFEQLTGLLRGKAGPTTATRPNRRTRRPPRHRPRDRPTQPHHPRLQPRSSNAPSAGSGTITA